MIVAPDPQAPVQALTEESHDADFTILPVLVPGSPTPVNSVTYPYPLISSSVVLERPELQQQPAEPDLDQPDVDQSHVDEPDMDQPHVDQPDVDQSDLDQPHVDEPDVDQSDLDEPDLDQPDVDQPGDHRDQLPGAGHRHASPPATISTR